MRYFMTLLMISAMAFGLACQNASSSSTETDKDMSAEVAKTEQPAEKKEDKKVEDKDTADETKAEKEGEAPRISLADAKKAYDAGEAVIIDTRAEVAFKNEHIKGAINVPAGEFEKAYNKVPKDKKIIAYCS